MDLRDYFKKLTSKEIQILQSLTSKFLTLKEISERANLNESAVYRLLKSLEAKDLVDLKEEENEFIVLSELGQIYVDKKLPELRLFEVVKQKGKVSLEDVKALGILDEGELSIAVGTLKKLNLVSLSKENNDLILTFNNSGNENKLAHIQNFLSKLPLNVQELSNEDLEIIKSLERRKNIIERKKEKIIYAKQKAKVKDLLALYEQNKDRIVLEVTPELIAEQNFDDKVWVEVDPSLDVEPVFGGRNHVVSDIIDYIREIWLELGFKEMVGNYIDLSFWNFDALFVPQDHPAREMQDTFFLPNKYKLDSKLLPPGDVIKNVKQAHQTGFVKGSKGWGYKWNIDEAMKIVLRTHTTVLSARYLYKLRDLPLPGKYFAVGKVFRNETMDWKHLFEIIQVEGIVASEKANFRQLLHYIKLFYKKMGFEEVRIRPAYFPYTEPSAEIEVKHPVTGKWLELGGCGVFRPEVTAPLYGKTIKVLAWGLGLDRLAFTAYNLKDIRDLYKNDLDFLRKAKLWI